MTPALPFTNQKMRERQQRRIRALEKAGMDRKNIAAHFDVDVSNFHAVMRDSSTYVLPARLSEGLLALLNSLHLFEHTEELLPYDAHVECDSEGSADGSYMDELLEGQEVLGDTSRAVKHMDHHEARSYGQSLMNIGARIQKEAALKIRKINGNGLFE